MDFEKLNNFDSQHLRFNSIKDCLYTDLNGEAVILSLKNGKYYGLNEVGVSIWKSIQDPFTFDEIKAAVMNDYDVTESICHEQVLTFLKKMAEEDLVEISNETVL